MKKILAAMVLFSISQISSADDKKPSWEPCGWGGGGGFWACAFHPEDGNIIYMGGDVSGMYKTTDKGLHWKMINKGLANYAVHSIAISKSAPDTLYALTADGVCRTADGGQNWTYMEQSHKDKLNICMHRPLSVRGIAIDPADPEIVYAGSRTGKLFKTSDGGKNWKELVYCKDLDAEVEKAPEANAEEVAGIDKDVKTSDDAKSATRKPSKTTQSGKAQLQSEATGNVVSSVSISGTDNNRIFITNVSRGVFRSDDAGKTWENVNSSTNASCVTVSPSDKNIAYGAFGAGDCMQRTSDGGKTWTAILEGIPEGYTAREIAVDPKNPDLIYCIGNSVWDGYAGRSEDGGKNWLFEREMKRDLAVNPTLPEEDFSGKIPKDHARMMRINNISISPANPSDIYIAGGWNPCFSADGGKTWEERSRGADISCITDIQFFGDKTYASVMDEGLLMSEDAGVNWKQIYPLERKKDINGHQWKILVSKKGDTEKILTTFSPWNESYPNRVLISEDGGKTFKAITQGLPNYVPKRDCVWGRSYIRSAVQDSKDPNILYLGMDGENDQRGGGGIFKSVDGGYTWKQLENQPPGRRIDRGLALDPENPDRIFWGTTGKTGGLYRSDDGGKTWKTVIENSQEDWILQILITTSGKVYCAGKSLWRSSDKGNTFEKIFDGSKDGWNGFSVAVDPAGENRIWISRGVAQHTAKGGISRTLDGGKNWEDITGDIPYIKPRILNYNPKTGYLWAGYVGLYKIKQ
ncbi:MAG TPA: hypothetical protein DET40_25495 [Lentisphaeria bacterium]|nr:MAG: hypothetical protein A2X45_18470 [Lentisphaerae bacterium GWF2_50_93]HCE46916.1 hypothetical protein [Lentisphaeria bacterium]